MYVWDKAARRWKHGVKHIPRSFLAAKVTDRPNFAAKHKTRPLLLWIVSNINYSVGYMDIASQIEFANSISINLGQKKELGVWKRNWSSTWDGKFAFSLSLHFGSGSSSFIVIARIGMWIRLARCKSGSAFFWISIRFSIRTFKSRFKVVIQTEKRFRTRLWHFKCLQSISKQAYVSIILLYRLKCSIGNSLSSIDWAYRGVRPINYQYIHMM